MLHYTFQVPENSRKLRGQLFTFLYANCDVKTISSPEEIEQDRFLAFSHPFDNWVFDYIIKNKNLNFFHIDNGYIGNHRHKTPWYYRISYNSLQNTKVKNIPYSRANLLEMDERLWSDDWNLKGDYNLIVLPNQSNIFKYLGEDYDKWKEKTLLYYNSLNIPLKVREKAGKRRQRFEQILPMMREAKKVITYHSMAAVEALCLGKPIEILGQSAVEHWQNKHSFDRQDMLEHISWSQFSRTEFQDGLAWKCTFDYQVEK